MDLLLLTFVYLSILTSSGSGAALPDLDDLVFYLPPTSNTVISLFHLGATPEDVMLAPNNGTWFNPNPAAHSVDRICVDSATRACAFSTEDGTWLAAYNNSNNGCLDISPSLVLNSGFCCVRLDDCVHLEQPFLATRAVNDASKSQQAHGNHSNASLILSGGNTSQSMMVPADGIPFSFRLKNDPISQVCINSSTASCIFQDVKGTAYMAYSWGNNGCIDVDPVEDLNHGFCCQDFHHCSALNISSHSLQNRGPIVNNTLAILYEGPPDIVGWEAVLTNREGFNVTDHIDWAVAQICLMSQTALCAFQAQDGTAIAVVGGQNGNCAVVGPPQLLVDGCCCNSPQQCDAPSQEAIARVAGAAIVASYMGTNATNSTETASSLSVAARETSANAITIQYWGANYEVYAFQVVEGDFTTFTTPTPWNVDQVCMIAPSGYCGFWSSDQSQGFDVGPVASGQTGACHTVGPPFIVAYGVCCDTPTGGNTAECTGSKLALRGDEHHDIQKRWMDVSNTTETNYDVEITFYGDPAVYTTAGGVTTYLRLLSDGRFVPLNAFGQPVVKVCVDTASSCQFRAGDDLGPSIYGDHGGCLDLNSSVTLTSVACD